MHLNKQHEQGKEPHKAAFVARKNTREGGADECIQHYSCYYPVADLAHVWICKFARPCEEIRRQQVGHGENYRTVIEDGKHLDMHCANVGAAAMICLPGLQGDN